VRNLVRHLFGRFYWVSYSKAVSYKGAWSKGLFNGFGQLEYKNGNTYRGYFKNGIRNGTGAFKSISGYTYRGQWIAGRKTGVANIKYINGDQYQGHLKNGLRHGVGELSLQSSDTSVEGKWQNDILDGEVRISCGAWDYDGPLPDAEGYSKGVLAYQDGSAYAGDCVNLIRKGVGVYESKTGVQIEGVWVTEVNVTNAVLKDEQGIVWRGSLKNLKPHGLMAVKLPSGHEYDGVWDNGTLQRLLSVENKRNNHPNQSDS
jgi:hypothetical protein